MTFLTSPLVPPSSLLLQPHSFCISAFLLRFYEISKLFFFSLGEISLFDKNSERISNKSETN